MYSHLNYPIVPPTLGTIGLNKLEVELSWGYLHITVINHGPTEMGIFKDIFL